MYLCVCWFMFSHWEQKALKFTLGHLPFNIWNHIPNWCRKCMPTVPPVHLPGFGISVRSWSTPLWSLIKHPLRTHAISQIFPKCQDAVIAMEYSIFVGEWRPLSWFIVYAASSELVILFYIHKSTRGPSHQDSNASVRYYTVTCKEHCTIGLASYSTQVPQSAFVLDHYWFHIRLSSNKLRTESNRSLRSSIRKD